MCGSPRPVPPFLRKKLTEAALFLNALRRLEAGRLQPVVNVRRRLGLPRSPQIQFPLHPRRRLLCQFVEAFSLFGKALFKCFLVFDARALDDHARSPCWRGRERRCMAFSSPFRLFARSPSLYKLNSPMPNWRRSLRYGPGGSLRARRSVLAAWSRKGEAATFDGMFMVAVPS